MSGIIKSLVGRECTVTIDFDNMNCTVQDVDDEWIQLLVHEKKNDKSIIVRVDSIEKIELL